MGNAKQPQGCLKRALVTTLSVVLIVSAVGFILYQRIGGSPGIKRRLANMALEATGDRMVRYRPDGVSEQEIRETIQQVHEANKKPGAVALLELYIILKEYDDAFHNSKPSNDEMLTYLTRLRGAIRRSEE